MKYICQKCSFIYDEVATKVKFNTLEDYKCPKCGASKEEFKKDFSKAIVESQEQIFGQDSSSALVSTPESRKYTEEVTSKIQKELDIK